ncbi:hypothetical protein [Vibrio breoganii]|nr:hypothetical protein [Vibrio breoganii]
MKAILGFLLVLLLPLCVHAQEELSYQDYIDDVKAAGLYDSEKPQDLSAGSGLNANSDSADNVSTADAAQTASKVATSERNSIISDARSGTISKANYADSTGTATRVSTTERNYIMSEARKRVCQSMPTRRWTTSSNTSWGCQIMNRTQYWESKYTWSGGVCSQSQYEYRTATGSLAGEKCGSGGGGGRR